LQPASYPPPAVWIGIDTTLRDNLAETRDESRALTPAPERPTTPATIDSASTSTPTVSDRRLAPTPSRDDAPDSAPGPTPTSPADHVLPCEAATGAVLSVMPGRGGRSDLIAAARRAAQAASEGIAGGDEPRAAPELAAVAPAGSSARLQVLIGATAAILIVLGLLQIAMIMVSPSDETALIMPSYTVVSPDVLPNVPGLAGVGEPTVAASAPDPFLTESTPEAETTGKVRLSPAVRNGAADTAAAAAASVKPTPSALGTNLDLAMPGPAQ
jgi:hypothetical protein